MTELFTTISEREAKVVSEILTTNNIHYICREERRENGLRFCIYVPERSIDIAYKLVDEGLLERDM